MAGKSGTSRAQVGARAWTPPVDPGAAVRSAGREGLTCTSCRRRSAARGGGAALRAWFWGSDLSRGGLPPPPTAAAVTSRTRLGPRPAYKAAGARRASGMLAHLVPAPASEPRDPEASARGSSELPSPAGPRAPPPPSPAAPLSPTTSSSSCDSRPSCPRDRDAAAPRNQWEPRCRRRRPWCCRSCCSAQVRTSRLRVSRRRVSHGGHHPSRERRPRSSVPELTTGGGGGGGERAGASDVPGREDGAGQSPKCCFSPAAGDLRDPRVRILPSADRETEFRQVKWLPQILRAVKSWTQSACLLPKFSISSVWWFYLDLPRGPHARRSREKP